MDTVTFPGTLDALSSIRQYVRTAAQAAGLEQSVAYNLVLAVDEIASNVIEHGYNEAGLNGDISVGAARDNDILEIRLEDTGKSYDPTAHPQITDIDLSKELRDRSVGGLGIMLARDGVDDLRYEATGSGNIHRFVVRLKPLTEPVQPAPLQDASDEHRKLQVLLRISKSLSQQIELEPLLELMVVEVTAAMRAERSTLFLVDREKPGELVAKVAEGVDAREIRTPFGVGIAGETAQTRQIVNITDAYKDSRFNSAIDKVSGFRTKSLLAVPIIAEDDQLIGVVEVMNKKGGGAFRNEDEGFLQDIPFDAGALGDGAFTRDDERFLEAICGDLSIALRRAEMVEAHLKGQIVTKSLQLARDIQMGLVPKDFPALPEFKEVDIFATMIPALEVGGDLYDFFPLDKDRICFVIGDVSDKGIPAALFMSMARTAFKISAIASPESISLTMRRVNQFLFESNRSQMFVTALAGVLDLQTGRVEYVDAGHEPPFILRPSGAILKVEKVGGVALGFCPDLSFRSGEIQLKGGDALVLYTDGVNEAMNTRRQLFGADAIEQSLSKVGRSASSGRIIEGLLNDLDVFVGGAEQSDDITVLAIRYLGRPEPSRT
jgi:serine phosphatase RsbU (regulator of sigma subunit)/anti-sigma regulatory factor (Ser/Thr protein kinase)